MASIKLIIGSHGMLGQELLKVFPNAVGYDYQEIDIADKEQVRQKITELNPDIVINAAAYNAVDKCEQDAKEYELAKKINGYAVGYLADMCKQINATLVHYSTNYLFDGARREGYNENSAPQPINKYGETKLLGEREILSAQGGQERENLKYYIIRLSKLFGNKGNSEMAKDNFFDIMIKLAETQNEVKVVDDELSNFTYAPDLAAATKQLLEQNFDSGIYHIVNENPCTWYEGARALFDILNINVNLIKVKASEFPRAAKRPKYGMLLNTKVPRVRDYREALREYLNH